MYHIMIRGDASNCTWTDLAIPTFAGVNCAKHWEEYRGLDQEEEGMGCGKSVCLGGRPRTVDVMN